MSDEQKKCRCGSGLERYGLYDARNIFVNYVCAACEQRIRDKYRPEIFLDPHYCADEPIDED